MMNLKTIIYSLTALLIPVGCNEDRQPEAVGSPESIMVTFTMRIENNNGGSTRSGESWGDFSPVEDGIGFDNRILDFAPVMYSVDQAGDKIIVADSKMDIKVYGVDTHTDVDGRTALTVVGEILTDMKPQQLGAGNYRLMLLANIAGHKGYMTYTDFDPDRNVFSYSGMPSESFNSIPMWGVVSVDLTDIRPGVAKNIGDVYLLRAMAQVRVSVDESLAAQKNVSLRSISLNRSYQRGYYAPSEWNSVTDTKKLEIDRTLRPKEDDTPVSLSVDAAEDPSCRILRLYLPEIKNKESDQPESDGSLMSCGDLRLTVEYSVDGIDRTGEIYFCNYSDTGKPLPDSMFDIVINHIYDFKIISVPDNDSDVTVNVTVKPWTTAGRWILDF